MSTQGSGTFIFCHVLRCFTSPFFQLLLFFVISFKRFHRNTIIVVVFHILLSTLLPINKKGIIISHLDKTSFRKVVKVMNSHFNLRLWRLVVISTPTIRGSFINLPKNNNIQIEKYNKQRWKYI